MKQLSPYYALFIKGQEAYKSNSRAKTKTAIELFEKALTFKKTEEAFTQLAARYARINDSQKYEQTILCAAETGFESFYSTCGLFYANNNERADREKSLKWFNKGIEKFDPKSYSDLARLYVTGCCLFKANIEQAEFLYLQGLELNTSKWNGYFAWALGLIYYEKKQFKDAAKYYEKAVKYGYMQATFYLALMYRDGIGVERDPNKYLEYLMMNLSPENAWEIAIVFFTGIYGEQDEKIAFDYCCYAASKGHVSAATMCAAYLISKKSKNTSAINKYLNIALRNDIDGERFYNELHKMESAFGKEVSDTLQKMAQKILIPHNSEA